jgi:ribosomal protein S18 acetylase RimI-like enzyme
MMIVSYAPMTAADLPCVHELWSQTDGVGLTDSDAPDVLQGFLDRNPNLSLVARDGSRLIGAVLCGHDGRRGFLYHLAVIPEYRGRGVGRRIVETCLASLSALGILKCNIFLYVDNEAGQRFWDRCGWTGRDDLNILQRVTS